MDSGLNLQQWIGVFIKRHTIRTEWYPSRYELTRASELFLDSHVTVMSKSQLFVKNWSYHPYCLVLSSIRLIWTYLTTVWSLSRPKPVIISSIFMYRAFYWLLSLALFWLAVLGQSLLFCTSFRQSSLLLVNSTKKTVLKCIFSPLDVLLRVLPSKVILYS